MCGREAEDPVQLPSAASIGVRMNFHQQAAIDRHAWRIFQSYYPKWKDLEDAAAQLKGSG